MMNHSFSFLNTNIPISIRTGIVANFQQYSETHIKSGRVADNTIASISSYNITKKEYTLFSDDNKETPHNLNGLDLLIADGQKISHFYAFGNSDNGCLLRILNHNTQRYVDVFSQTNKEGITQWNYPGIYRLLHKLFNSLVFTILYFALFALIPSMILSFQAMSWTINYESMVFSIFIAYFLLLFFYSLRDRMIWKKRMTFIENLNKITSEVSKFEQDN